MPLNGCSSGLVLTALVTLLALPVSYFVPDIYSGLEEGLTSVVTSPPTVKDVGTVWFDHTFKHFPPLDVFVTVTLFLLGLLNYICEWINRKLMERRLVKLNQYLTQSVERLREWDAQQEQVEATLKMVQTATSEYNLLLYLLLRRQKRLATRSGPPSSTASTAS